jgi:hypothetical protein
MKEDHTPCKGETFEVTVDKRLDGIVILRLDCATCGETILHDLRLVEKKPDGPTETTILKANG